MININADFQSMNVKDIFFRAFFKLAYSFDLKSNISWKNQSSHSNYRALYNGLTKKIIGKVYEEGLDIFKYSF